MKPHLMRRSDFIGNKGIVEQSNAGILVVREGNKYQVGVEVDVDTMVFINETTDKSQIPELIDNTLEEIETIREKFAGCFTD